MYPFTRLRFFDDRRRLNQPLECYVGVLILSGATVQGRTSKMHFSMWLFLVYGRHNDGDFEGERFGLGPGGACCRALRRN